MWYLSARMVYLVQSLALWLFPLPVSSPFIKPRRQNVLWKELWRCHYRTSSGPLLTSQITGLPRFCTIFPSPGTSGRGVGGCGSMTGRWGRTTRLSQKCPVVPPTDCCGRTLPARYSEQASMVRTFPLSLLPAADTWQLRFSSRELFLVRHAAIGQLQDNKSARYGNQNISNFTKMLHRDCL